MTSVRAKDGAGLYLNPDEGLDLVAKNWQWHTAGSMGSQFPNSFPGIVQKIKASQIERRAIIPHSRFSAPPHAAIRASGF